MATISQYWPSDFWPDMNQALAWLLSRQSGPAGNWLGNAVYTQGATTFPDTPAASSGLVECGISSQTNFETGVMASGAQGSPFPQQQVENISLALPAGLYPDNLLGPDGYPINESPQALPWGNLLCNGYTITSQMIAAVNYELYNPTSSYVSPGPPQTPGVVAKWSAGTGYSFGQMIVDGNGNTELALVSGVTCASGIGSCNGEPPNWPTTLGALTADNTEVWRLIAAGYQPGFVALGYCFNLLQPLGSYRVDLFTLSDQFYYQGSSPVHILGANSLQNAGTFSIANVRAGFAFAALYPTSVSPPSSGWSGANIAAGWVAHSNMGIGYKLAGYKAQVYSESGATESLQEDNIPIIVQSDEFHARAGSSVQLASGVTPTVHLLYNDPVSGWTGVYSSRETLNEYQELPRSYDVPTSDPLYAPDPTQSSTPAIQNRSLTYDCALAIIAYSGANNFAAANKIIQQLNYFLANPGSLPANSLAESYDTYHGQVDQSTVQSGAIAWVGYAYCVYMQTSLDFSSALDLQAMLNYLLTLQSSASDLTNGLFYQDTTETSVKAQDQAVIYFTLMRAAGALSTAATQLVKNGTITPAQASSLQSTASTIQTAAGTISTKMVANIYIAAGGGAPGHFAQGASSSGLDTSQALEGGGAWGALFADAIGRDDVALQCLEFAYQNFLLADQQIQKSSASNSYNEAYQQVTTFSGIKPFNDSSGGYSGSPLSVGMEATWSLILALLRLYNISGLAAYFTGLGASLDSVLGALVAGQATVFSTIGNGSLIGYSLASRSSPYFFYVWPAVSPTAWMWLTAINPSLLLTVASQPAMLPYLIIPNGQNQSVRDVDGASSVGQFSIECIDPGGVLKALAAQANILGQMATFSLGFPGLAAGDFVPLHTVQITDVGFDSTGKVKITCGDVQRFFTGAVLWAQGGPDEYLPGNPPTAQPIGPSWLPNAFPVSQNNPRWLSGNPLDIYLAAMQNELGVGQDPSLVPNLGQSGNTEGMATANPFWVKYEPGQSATLINPNQYLDVPGILALKNGMFSGDWFEFKITSPVSAKGWLEDYILKPLGLVSVVHSNGLLSLKAMKNPQNQSPVFAFTAKNVIGIPQVSREPIINVLTMRMDVNDALPTTASRAYNNQVTYEQQTSIYQYRRIFSQQVEATGLRAAYGGYLRSFLLADRVFRRYGFGTPRYQVKAFLASAPVEIGDYVTLSHPLVPDVKSGQVGVMNVLCEAIGRTPNYARGQMTFDLFDTRFMQLTTPYQIAPLAAGIPAWSQATPAQQQQYFFVSSAGLTIQQPSIS